MENKQVQINFDTPRPTPTRPEIPTSMESQDVLERTGKKGKYRRLIYDFIEARGENGATCDEIEVELALRHQTASCFIRFLTQDFFLKDSGQKRRTRAGRQAIVWVKK